MLIGLAVEVTVAKELLSLNLAVMIFYFMNLILSIIINKEFLP